MYFEYAYCANLRPMTRSTRPASLVVYLFGLIVLWADDLEHFVHIAEACSVYLIRPKWWTLYRGWSYWNAGHSPSPMALESLSCGVPMVGIPIDNEQPGVAASVA